MKKMVLIILLVPVVLLALSGEDIIRRVDNNQLFQDQKFTATMIIEKDGRRLVKKFHGYGMNHGKKSFMEFTNPEDRGVKYLKIENELWIYFPDADDIMRISGHMLRQGMMGSDISYEDMMEEERLEERYDITLKGKETVRGRPCYVVELKSVVPDTTYARQVLYVDTTRFVSLKLELYARGGRLIKVMQQMDVRNSRGRWYPAEIVIRDMRRKNSKTTVRFSSMAFNVGVPESVFTKRNLRR